MLEEELNAIKREFAEIEARLSSGGLKPEEIEKFSRRHAVCRQLLDTEAALGKAQREAEDTRQMLSSTDREIAEMAAAELPGLEAAAASLGKKLKLLIIPPDPADSKTSSLKYAPAWAATKARFSPRICCACTPASPRPWAGRRICATFPQQALKA